MPAMIIAPVCQTAAFAGQMLCVQADTVKAIWAGLKKESAGNLSAIFKKIKS